MSGAPIHSTGRGGAGNVGADPTQYVDAGIVREGVQGISPEGEYSSGRGGAGNMVNSPRIGATDDGRRSSQDIVPEANLVPHEGHENFHTGRGGGGNVHKDKYGGHSHDPTKQSLLDKAKELIHPHHKGDKPKSEGA